MKVVQSAVSRNGREDQPGFNQARMVVPSLRSVQVQVCLSPLLATGSASEQGKERGRIAGSGPSPGRGRRRRCGPRGSTVSQFRRVRTRWMIPTTAPEDPSGGCRVRPPARPSRSGDPWASSRGHAAVARSHGQRQTCRGRSPIPTACASRPPDTSLPASNSARQRQTRERAPCKHSAGRRSASGARP